MGAGSTLTLPGDVLVDRDITVDHGATMIGVSQALRLRDGEPYTFPSSDIWGCMNSSKADYNPIATQPTNCSERLRGCTYTFAQNYNAQADVNDGSCKVGPVTSGCLDPG